MSTSRTEFYSHFDGDSTLENYKGLVSHALPGLHGYIVEMLKRHGILVTSNPLLPTIDLGAGQGALSLRLFDNGCSVTACDLVESNFGAVHHGIRFLQIDLNTEFSNIFNNQRIDLICAVEVAEHIENPRHLLRQCHKVLSEAGMIVITTPNIDSPRSKVDYLVEGQFHMFRDSSYRSSGHITPITGWQLLKMTDELGLEIVEHTTFGRQDYTFGDRPKAYLAQEMIRRVGAKCPWGEGAIHVALLTKRLAKS